MKYKDEHKKMHGKMHEIPKQTKKGKRDKK